MQDLGSDKLCTTDLLAKLFRNTPDFFGKRQNNGPGPSIGIFTSRERPTVGISFAEEDLVEGDPGYFGCYVSTGAHTRVSGLTA